MPGAPEVPADAILKKLQPQLSPATGGQEGEQQAATAGATVLQKCQLHLTRQHRTIFFSFIDITFFKCLGGIKSHSFYSNFTVQPKQFARILIF